MRLLSEVTILPVMFSQIKNETVHKGDDPPSAVTSDKNEPIKDRKKNKKAKLAAKELPKTNNNANCPATHSFESL